MNIYATYFYIFRPDLSFENVLTYSFIYFDEICEIQTQRAFRHLKVQEIFS